MMSIDTLRTSKMRSALTVLGVVIGITSIVGMTSLIRGFDNSLRESISQLGPNTIIVQKMGSAQLRVRQELPRSRAPSEPDDGGRAGDRARLPVGRAGRRLARRDAATRRSRIYYGTDKRPSRSAIFGATENWAAVNFAKLEMGRLFMPAEVEHRRQVVVLGNSPWQSLFPNIDPIGKTVRIGANQFTVIGVLGKRPSPGGFSSGVDDFAVIPYGAYEKFYGKVLKGSAKISAGNFNPAVFRTAMIAVVPREGMREAAMREVEAIMRIRHRLKLERAERLRPGDAGRGAEGVGSDQPGDVPGAGRHLLDRADGRRHRRHGDHDDLGDRADARNRRPQGARRAPARDPLAVPDRSGVPHLGRRRCSASSSAAASACSSTGCRASPCRCPGGRSRSASASRPASASSSVCSPRSRPRGWIRSKRCDTSNAGSGRRTSLEFPSPRDTGRKKMVQPRLGFALRT